MAPAGGERFGFTGTAGEYFGIWIVNLFLTLVTLGIYSAWAKVRKKRYFYEHTWLAGQNFAYHGNPVAILKGRLVAVTAFIAYSMAAAFSPRLGAVILALMMPAVPWLIVRSFAFNAVNSSHRNLRFHFDGTYREALAATWPLLLVVVVGALLPEPAQQEDTRWADIGWAFVPLLLFGASYPYSVARVRLLQGNRSRFGTARFACTARVEAFYRIYAIALGLLLVTATLVGALAMLSLKVLSADLFIPVVFAGYVLIAALLLGFTRSRVANLVFNAASLEAVTFASTLSGSRLARIYAVNLFAIVFTLGLAIPWAAVRTARYRAESLAVRAEDGLDRFLGEVTRDVAAAGEEAGEVFDIDLSL